MDPEGRFGLDVPATWRWCALTISGRHLYLTVPHVAKGSAPEGEIELLPHLGGWVRGAAALPPGHDAAAVEFTEGQVLAAPVPALLPSPGGDSHTNPAPRVVSLRVDGSFELRGLPPGVPYLVRGRTADFPRSTIGEVEVGPGETRDLILELVRDGTLTGEVFAADGRPTANVPVYMVHVDSSETHRVRTNEAGKFRAEGLLPGPWRVWTAPADSVPGTEEAAGAEAGAEQAATAFLEGGIETHVVLGREPPRKIRVLGTVTAAGVPLTGHVRMHARGRTPLADAPETSLDAEGRFTLDLPGPGPYLVTIDPDGGHGSSAAISLLTNVPATDRHPLPLTVPTGRIEGLVRGPDGAPVEDAEVLLRREGPVPEPGMPGGGTTRAWTDEEGRYAFAFLPADTYGIAVHPRRDGGDAGADAHEEPPPPPAPSLARPYTGGRVLGEGATLSGVAFDLTAGGWIEGVVRDAGGQPASGATVYVRDARGALLEVASRMTTGRDGLFRLDALPPGPHTVFARTAEEATVESEPLVVQAGTKCEVELTLRPGARLRVVTLSVAGEARGTRLLVTDAKGGRVNALGGAAGGRPAAPALGTHLVGPLPPGTYTVWVVGEAGGATETIELAAGEERELRLRLE